MAKAKAKRTKGKRKEGQDLADQILGQMIFATGSGAAGQWVSMEAIAEIRTFFSPFVLEVIGKKGPSKGTQEWKQDAAHVLHYMDTIGRVAAQKSIAAGQYWIEAKVMVEAIDLVVGEVSNPSPRLKPPIRPLGKWCGN